jgi:EmrB/QacA subfamily drug resistance transporter
MRGLTEHVTATETEPTVAGPRHTTAILAIVLISYLMIVLDISIVITALPRMRASLGFSATGLSWVQNAYTLTFGGLLLPGARAGDIVGRRRMFINGIAIFTAASFAVGIAQSPTWLIAARAAQGLGAAVLAPSSLALLSTGFTEGRERTRAVSYYGAVAGVGASLGLVLGGIPTSLVSWRVGFFINVPIGVAMIIAAPRFLPETQPRPGDLDVLGAIYSTLGMTALVYGIVRSADDGWGDDVTVAALAFGVALVICFVVNEWRVEQPVMPLRLFVDRERTGAYAGRILYLGAMLGFWFFITQFLQSVYHYTPLEAGIAFLPLSVANFAVAITVPKLTRRWGNAWVLAAGVAVTFLGMAWLSRLSADTPYLTGIALPMVLLGIGQGASLGPLTAAGIARVTADDAGAASGLVNVAHQLGGSLGLGILVTVFAAASSSTLTGSAQLAHQVSAALTVGTGLLALALIVVLALIAAPRRAPVKGHRVTAPPTTI